MVLSSDELASGIADGDQLPVSATTTESADIIIRQPITQVGPVYAGHGDNANGFAAGGGNLVVLTVATATFPATMVGSRITITHATSALNNGTFVVTAAGGGDTITFTNLTPGALPEVFPTAGLYSVSATGAADDVTVFAAGSLPCKMRILDAFAYVSQLFSTSTLQVRSAAAAGGTLCAEMASTVAGRNTQTATVTATQVLTPSATTGLFIRRSNNVVTGEVIIRARRES
jgi:hypothetical protein